VVSPDLEEKPVGGKKPIREKRGGGVADAFVPETKLLGGKKEGFLILRAVTCKKKRR